MLSECKASKFRELEYLRDFVKNNPFNSVYDTEEAEIEVAKFFYFYDVFEHGSTQEYFIYFEVDKRDDEFEFVNNQYAVRQSLESLTLQFDIELITDFIKSRKYYTRLIIIYQARIPREGIDGMICRSYMTLGRGDQSKTVEMEHAYNEVRCNLVSFIGSEGVRNRFLYK